MSGSKKSSHKEDYKSKSVEQSKSKTDGNGLDINEIQNMLKNMDMKQVQDLISNIDMNEMQKALRNVDFNQLAMIMKFINSISSKK